MSTTHRSTLESTVYEKEITQLEVRQMITITKAMQRDEADQHQAETCWERTRFSHPYSRVNRPSIDDKPTSSIDIRPRPPSTVSVKPQYDNQYLTQDEFGIFRDPDGYARAIDGHALQISQEDIADIHQMANGADTLFMQQRNSQTHQQRVTSEIYNTTGGVDDHFKQKSRQHTRPSIDGRPEFGKRACDHDGTRRFHWEEKDEYGVYRDDHGHTRDVDGHIISVSKEDIRSLLERASRDEHSYLCLPEHARSFTHTKLIPEIYTKDEINEIFYGVCGAQEKNEEERLDKRCDDIYFPMDLTISSLLSKIEAIQREIVEIQGYIACRPEASASIDRHNNKSTDSRRRTSVDEATNQGRLVPKVKSDMSDTHNHGEEISDDAYVTLIRNQFQLETFDDILQKIENATASMKDIWRRGDEAEPKLASNLIELNSACLGAWYTWDRILQTSLEEASASIDRHNNKSTDSRRRTSVDEATNRGRLVPKVKSDMSDTHNHGEEISDDAYVTLIRNQFQLESFDDILQKIENATASMKDIWRRGDEPEPKLASNLIELNSACLGAWYTWDRILQTSLEGKGLEQDLVATTIKA
ncbi:hypothetical protein F2Q68_00044244 [Brassica cretica]|uniref:Uncharacterized protein n=1 Tax=Brassica cretica TaxID=69181 RepID=A0A8S9LIE1_BRACR|nr:hypothetical protein F2Q68_00044244 [Brassica cretica]